MKKKKLALIAFFVFVLIVLVFSLSKLNFPKNDLSIKSEKLVNNSHDGTYLIAGQKVTLVNGISEVEVAPGSASKIITRYFGDDITGDFDNDGNQDLAFLLTQETGGSGVFYYAVALLNKTTGRVGTEGVFLGDRIAPQNIALKDKNILVVNYADRKTGEDFTIAPSVGKSIYLKLDPKTSQFGEVVQNFEGEAEPARMALNMKTWEWTNTIYNNDTEVKPLSDKKFTLTLNKDNTFSATTDCNGVGGKYVVDGNKITFSKMASTLMYCENSQEADFTKMLSETQNYLFTSKGQLVFTLNFDSGSVFFR